MIDRHVSKPDTMKNRERDKDFRINTNPIRTNP